MKQKLYQVREKIVKRLTYTVALLEVSQETYNEIRTKLVNAGYKDCITKEGHLDMSELALTTKEEN